MQTPLPKLATAALVVIALAVVLIAYKLFNAPDKPDEEKVIYVDASSGKVYERQASGTKPRESTEEKLRKEFPDGKTY